MLYKLLVYVYTYIHTHTHTHIYIHIYQHIYLVYINAIFYCIVYRIKTKSECSVQLKCLKRFWPVFDCSVCTEPTHVGGVVGRIRALCCCYSLTICSLLFPRLSQKTHSSQRHKDLGDRERKAKRFIFRKKYYWASGVRDGSWFKST